MKIRRGNVRPCSHGRGSVLLRRGDKIPRKRVSVGGIFPISNALYSIAFGPHTEAAEPIDMPFGMISGLGPKNGALRVSDDPQRGSGNFEGKHVTDFA